MTAGADQGSGVADHVLRPRTRVEENVADLHRAPHAFIEAARRPPTVDDPSIGETESAMA